jgi:hypothetical protein
MFEEHDPAMMVLAAIVAVGTSYGGLRIFLARHGGRRLSLIAFGLGPGSVKSVPFH